MLRRLHPEQPESFAFTPDNQAWAEAQMTKYPEGRQASAIIPLLWRAQEQEGWLSRPAIEHVSEMLGMAYIRGLEVATFYFMFQLQPVGSVAHVQVCGTTSCMICGAEDLIGVCKERIAPRAHELSADGKFSWEEVECLGACSNAPMAQIGKDYYEDLTAERLGEIIDEMAAGDVPVPGPQNGRYASEPAAGLTSLKDHAEGRPEYNASADLAVSIGDTIKRIDGTEVPLTTPWQDNGVDEDADGVAPRDDLMAPSGPDGAQGGRTEAEAPAPRDVGDSSDKYSEAEGEAPNVEATGRPDEGSVAPPEKNTGVGAESGHPAPEATPSAKDADPGTRPVALSTARDAGADDLKKIKGIGPKVEKTLNDMGIYHYDQIAGWSPEEVAWVDQNLKGFKGRASRDAWVAQAGGLVSGSKDK
ncbi:MULTISPECIES: NADH-quinone oxidoreductase subunit E [unclassified Sulfitobacter]|uniref:NADH-quinone oxidoreductase subunit E n=1 Tax=unclassified Sulfitobacter TaxID=196795 RepID=UPI0007C31C45|nr:MULTISPECIES: NADH-quinone oxidoreductase subunit E [unclassified Sulfitobacter]KZY05694.1 fused NADH-quinone oxidoreductase subunit E/endonuclease [Sulfitobacter sp. HI0023]KZY22310.1 fused NADH-quinone oxidoreductase subunit E/endonuclease [Sulfitobacter sp. HI0040]KZZ70141.1 fused NADH-quinone oxidoreductase subunit E/endonuclease [Sulfitobacter sp. HI0129]